MGRPAAEVRLLHREVVVDSNMHRRYQACRLQHPEEGSPQVTAQADGTDNIAQ